MFLDSNNTCVLPVLNKNDALIIKFYGHSLNEADYSYFQSIFDSYGLYDKQNILLEFYYTPHKDGIKSEVIDSVYKLINKYGSTLYNEDQRKNLMHKLILEKRVTIKEIPLKNEMHFMSRGQDN